MGPVAIIAGIGAAVGAVGAYASYKQQKKAVKLQKQANRYQRAQDNLKAARERKEAVRNARISQGAVLQSSVNQGSQDTSAALGGLGSIQTQANQGLSFLDQYNTLSDQASIALGRANKASASAQVWGQVSDFGFKISGNAGGIVKSVKGS